MVVNRSFEYGELAEGDQLHGWSRVGGADYDVIIDAEDSLNVNNPNYLVINNTTGTKSGIANKGFLEGMAIKKGTTYATRVKNAMVRKPFKTRSVGSMTDPCLPNVRFAL
ncbi:MAG: hypothetical protein IIV18_00745, partial [Lachnospiraceae bacterium]|nr:hypothetical protein [Lachnospiraceae bacterium]